MNTALPPNVEVKFEPFRNSEIAVFEAGPNIGVPIGYLHGMLGNPALIPFVDRLAEATGRKVVAPSLPGFIPSPPRNDLRDIYDWIVATSEVLDIAGLIGAPVVASSIGAMLAMELAAVRPESFSAILALSPLGLWNDEAQVLDMFSSTARDLPGLLLSDPTAGALFFDNDEAANADSRLELSVARYCTQRSAASLVWPIPDHGLLERMHRIQCPVGLLWGSCDRVNPAISVDAWAEALPNHIGTEFIEDAGHCVEWDQPKATSSAVLRFLETIDAV